MARGIIERARLGVASHAVHLGGGCLAVLAISSLHAMHVWPWAPPADAPAPREPTRHASERAPMLEERPSVTRVTSEHVDVDVVVGRCAVGMTCTVRLQLVPHRTFHVSAEYPQKFVADAGSPFALEGQGPERRTFRRTFEAFRRPGEDVVTFAITFVPKAPGDTPLSGVMKASVCDEQICVIDTPRIALTVPVT